MKKNKKPKRKDLEEFGIFLDIILDSVTEYWVERNDPLSEKYNPEFKRIQKNLYELSQIFTETHEKYNEFFSKERDTKKLRDKILKEFFKILEKKKGNKWIIQRN